jgi:hypothetical protein
LKPFGGMRTQFEPSEARRVAAATNPSPSTAYHRQLEAQLEPSAK